MHTIIGSSPAAGSQRGKTGAAHAWARCCALLLVSSALLIEACSGCGSSKHGLSDTQQPANCKPATQRCDGDVQQTCGPDGKTWITAECPCGCVVEGDRGQCASAVCDPGKVRCDETGTKLQTCSAQGCGWTEGDCPLGCSADRLACNTCAPTTRRCRADGDAETCSALGEKWIAEPCVAACDPATNECGSCQPGTRRCEPTQSKVVQTCKSEAEGWVTLESCELGCSVDTKACNQCVPGMKTCSHGNLVRCNATGDLRVLEQACEISCNEKTLSCNSCKPGTGRCVAGVNYETCDGSGWTLVETCALGCETKTSQCRACITDQQACLEGNIMLCRADGLGWQLLEACPHGCDVASKQCVGCKPGATRCLGETLEICDGAGLTWEKTLSCEFGCGADQLACKVCKPGATVCDGANQRTCKSDGSGWEVTPCAEGCNVALGMCNLCKPFTLSCQGEDTNHWCNFDGSGWIDFTCTKGCSADGKCRYCTANALSCDMSNHVQQCDASGTVLTKVEGCRHVCKTIEDPQISCVDRRYLDVSMGSQYLPYERICAVATDKTLWCWGWINDGGVPRHLPKPARFGDEADRWIAVRDSAHHGCGIKEDKSLWCWGHSSSGELGYGGYLEKPQPTAVVGNASWQSIGIGVMHSCGIRIDGTLWCWGRNLEGQLGTGVAGLDFPTPQQVTTASSLAWLRVAAHQQTCAIQGVDGKTDVGRLSCWGMNNYGEVGRDPQQSPKVMTPQEVAANTLWRDVDTGWDGLTCGIQEDGSLWCWGKNVNGLFGDNTPAVHQPQKIDDGPWLNVSVGTQPCAISPGALNPEGGQIRCWALYESWNELTLSSALVEPATGWKRLARGSLNTCATDTDDHLWCWYGIDSFARDLGTPVSGSTLWRETAVGKDLSCGISTANQLYCWGQGFSWIPQLIGIGSWKKVALAVFNGCAIDGGGALHCWSSYGKPPEPVPVASGSTVPWFAISVGQSANCGIRTDGSLWCWGLNGEGQVGDGTTTKREAPVPIMAGSSWQRVSVGTIHTCGVQTDGSLWCWGSGSNGRLGLGTAENHLSPQRVGQERWKSVVMLTSNTSCAIREDETLWCWGGNFVHLGEVASPLQVGVDRWSSLGSGLGIQIDGSLWRISLGSNSVLSQVTEPKLASWLVVSLGEASQGCVIGIDFKLYCWGSNQFGQLGIGLPTSITTRYLESD